MTDWLPVDRILGDWGDPAVEARERKLLSQTEAEARLKRRREQERQERDADKTVR